MSARAQVMTFFWTAEDLAARGGKLDLHTDVRPRHYAIDKQVREHGLPDRVEREESKDRKRVLFRLTWEPRATIDPSGPREASPTPERGTA